jgi:Na+-transporting methylmalonyl-CoA/oxaloacetate decarboxylase beta subunit
MLNSRRKGAHLRARLRALEWRRLLLLMLLSLLLMMVAVIQDAAPALLAPQAPALVITNENKDTGRKLSRARTRR